MFIYPHWRVDTPAQAWQWLLSPGRRCALLGLSSGRSAGGGPELLAGLLFFGGTLFPALGFFNVYPFMFSYGGRSLPIPGLPRLDRAGGRPGPVTKTLRCRPGRSPAAKRASVSSTAGAGPPPDIGRTDLAPGPHLPERGDPLPRHACPQSRQLADGLQPRRRTGRQGPEDRGGGEISAGSGIEAGSVRRPQQSRHSSGPCRKTGRGDRPIPPGHRRRRGGSGLRQGPGPVLLVPGERGEHVL